MLREDLNTPSMRPKRTIRNLTPIILRLSQFSLSETQPNTNLLILNPSKRTHHINQWLNNLLQPLEVSTKNGFLMFLSALLTNADTLRSPSTSNHSLSSKTTKPNTTEAPRKLPCSKLMKLFSTETVNHTKIGKKSLTSIHSRLSMKPTNIS